MLSLAGFAWTPCDASQPLFRDVTLRLHPGDCALLSGATGAGKSTLLRAIAGAQAPGGTPSGELHIEGRTVLLFQNADTQLLFSTVGEEVASGLRGARGDRARVDSALAEHGLAALAHRAVEDLSAGERQRVLLAALLASEPSLLLLDEPTRALDLGERARLVSTLEGVVSRGCAVLIAEHRIEPFRALVNRHFALEGGRLRERGAPRTAPNRERCAAQLERSAPSAPRLERNRLLHCRGVGVRDLDGHTRLPATDLEIYRGDRVLICGANGAGKTTLLGVLAGLVPASYGRIEPARALAAGARGRIDSGQLPAPARGDSRRQQVPGRIALVLQCPPRNLFASSVFEEVAFTLERAGWPAARIERRVRELLDACGLAPQRERSPLRLSFGEQHRIAIAAALAAEPALLLLDEPCSGLDARSRAQLLELLDREQARTHMAIAIAAPHAEGLEGWAQRRVDLRHASAPRRTPIADSPPRAALAHAPRRARRSAAARACHYRDTGSALHRLAVGWKLAAVALGGAAAIAAREPLALALLLVAWLAGYRLARLSAAELWRDMRWLLAQGAVIVALSSLREDAHGAAAGLRAAAQIALFFLPGALLLRTTPTGRLLASLQRALPARLAFALATSLRFVPFFARETREIVSVQRLRGARLHPRDAWRARAWRDAVECVGVPLAVRAIHTANEVALAAEVRGIPSVSSREASPCSHAG